MRTAAVQCCHGQDRIDKVIPVFWATPNSTEDPRDRMSTLMISDRARQVSSKADLKLIHCNHPHILGCTTARPSVAILLDMGLSESEVEAEYDPTEQKCLRIYAAAINEDTFPFLYGRALVEDFNLIIRHAREPETKTPETTALRARMSFGATSFPSHMEWERGGMIHRDD